VHPIEEEKIGLILENILLIIYLYIYKHALQLENYVFHIRNLFSYEKFICLLFFEVYEVIFQLDFVDTCIPISFFSTIT